MLHITSLWLEESRAGKEGRVEVHASRERCSLATREFLAIIGSDKDADGGEAFETVEQRIASEAMRDTELLAKLAERGVVPVRASARATMDGDANITDVKVTLVVQD